MADQPPPPPTERIDEPPPPGGGDEPPSGGTPKKPWWKRWWGIAAIVLVVIIAIGAMGDTEDTDDVASEATTSPEPDPTTDKPTEDETTELAEEITEEPSPTPTPTYTLTADDMRTAAFPIVFDSSRDGILEVLRDMTIVESVDLYEYDEEEGTVLLSVTPAFDFDEGVRDDAWTIMREFATLYTTEHWISNDVDWSPVLDVEISTAHYRCDGETMMAIEDARASRSDWEQECRVS